MLFAIFNDTAQLPHLIDQIVGELDWSGDGVIAFLTILDRDKRDLVRAPVRLVHGQSQFVD